MIQQLIDNALLAEQCIKARRIRSGKFSPSSFGRCYRYQYWNRKDEPMTNPPDVEALRRFKVGNIIHDYMQSFFPLAQKEVKVAPSDDIIGYADIVLDDEVVDIKSCRTFEFKSMLKDGYDIGISKTTNVLQVASYALFLNKPKARLIFIEKDALDSKEFELNVKDWVVAINDELTILRGHWQRQELPKPIPRAYGGKECQYCSFMTKCFTMEDKEIK